MNRRPSTVVPTTRSIRRGARAHLVEHAEPLQHRHPGRLQQQPRAHRAGIRRALEHLDGVARAREQRGRGQPGGSGAHDPDSHL